MSEFEGKVVLVSGAGRGSGRTIAAAFAARGAIVAANDITPINLDVTLAEIDAAGGRARGYVYDVAKRMPVETMINEVLDDWGRIDFLVNHASVKPRASILDMDEWDWQRALDVNLSGPFYLMQQAGRVLREQGGGAIVNIVSSADPAQDSHNGAAYSAGKMGLIGLTREAAREFSAYGIRVNAVCPRWIEKDENREVAPEQGRAEGSPSQLLPANKVAETVIYLCSAAAEGVSGQVIEVVV